MKIIVYSDPHQGLNLAANTTPRSRERLRNSIRHKAEEVSGEEADTVICLGDFFHSFRNSEDVLLSSLTVADNTDIILGGNHDVVNDASKKSTLHVINEIFPDKVVLPEFGEVVVHCRVTDNSRFVMVPHHSSTDLFEKALEESKKYAEGPVNYLCLHCNYDSGFATQDTALNITSKRAKELLEHFDYILIGHDHHYKTDHDGRVVVLGNIHPTNFGDICDKFYLEINTEDHSHVLGRCWNEDAYIEVDFQELDLVNPTEHQWVRVTGKAEPSMIPELSRSIKRLWDTEGCSIFAIRSEVKIVSDIKSASAASSLSTTNLKEAIKEQLAEEPELLKMWEEVSDDSDSD